MAERGVVERRRSTRLALVEVANNEPQPTHETPTKNSPSPDEMLIIARGPRRKPITWSPVDVVIALMEEGDDERTPEKVPPKRLNPNLRRRLNLSPTKNSSSLGNIIAKKLKSLPQVPQSPDQ